MSIHLYGAFVIACIVLAMTPGPNMALFIANGATYGTRAALLTVLGSTAGLAVLVTAATLGMSSIMAFVSEWFDLIRWIGVIYLIYLGLTRIRSALCQGNDDTVPAPAGRGRYIWHGTIMSLSNPKVLLFLGAFFPQFIDPSAAISPQLALLAVTFVLIIAAVDVLMVFALGMARGWFAGRRRRLAEGFGGVLLVCGGLWLATARRA